MSNLRISELDFDEIKDNLKTFLENQSEFTDFDFEGAGLSVLLDILAYNTHYNAYLANMLANEMFLDSAVKRTSAVSLAKHLGYLPRSARGSKAIVDIVVSNPAGSPSTLTLESFTSFSTSIGGTTYSFLNIEPVTIEPSGGVYQFNDVEIIQGVPLAFSYTVSTLGPDVKYEIPNPGVDTSTIKVSVQTSSSDTSLERFTQATDITNVSNTSAVFFLEETSTETYNIYFGDDVIGKKLSPGNIIIIEYLVVDGQGTNVSSTITQSFTCDTNIGSASGITVTTVSNPAGGADKESIESIKYNAPRSYRANNRAVTIEDFKSIILSNVTEVESVSVWGGEDNIPPAFGKVFISMKPYVGSAITPALKNNIINNILKPKQVATITTEIVDPDYIYVALDVRVKYNKNQTTRSSATIKNLVNSTINNFFDTKLEKFNLNFYHSQLINSITNIDTSIISVQAGIQIQKRIVPTLNLDTSFLGANSIKMSNPIEPGTIRSTRYFIIVDGATVTARLRDVPDIMPPNDTGTGTIVQYNINTGSTIGSIGAINYSTGEITIRDLLIVGLPITQFDIRIQGTVQEDRFDIEVQNNQVILLDDSTEDLNTNRTPGLTIDIAAI